MSQKLALILATAALIISGAGYRLLGARYASLSSSTPIPVGTLDQIPIRIGAWVGRSQPIDPEIVKMTDTDDRVSRIYNRGPESLNLYVTYGVRLRDLQPHRPEVCYQGAGWILETQRIENLPLENVGLTQTSGNRLPVQIQTFSRGEASELSHQQQTVLNYYIVNDIYSADVSDLRREASRLSARPHPYSAQVQISCSGSGEPAAMLVRSFAQESAGSIREVLIRAVHGSAPE